MGVQNGLRMKLLLKQGRTYIDTPPCVCCPETFLLFSHAIPSQNLGFVDPAAQTLDLSVAGRDVVVHQSPAVLASNRAGGTTGAGELDLWPPPLRASVGL